MNRRMAKFVVLGLVVLTATICYSGEQTEDENLDFGRDDPFAGVFGGAMPQGDLAVPVGKNLDEIKPLLFVQTVTLKFLSARNLKTALTKMSSEYGSIAVDDNTNTLIICDVKEDLERIITEVRKADQTPKQIMIEVVIIDVKLKDDTEIGIDWDILSTKNYDFAYRQSMVYPDRLAIVAPDSDSIGNTSAYATTGGLGGEMSVISNTIRNVVHLLQEKRTVDILASPRVMVVSGQMAGIKTVEEIPYQELTQTAGGGGGGNAVTSTAFKEVGVTLEVKATVTDEGQILLTVKPSQSVSTGTSIANVPVVDTREANTTLLIDDGQVVVMGGLRRQETQTIRYQVPLLGDLPLIGLLFSDDRKVVENSELLVLLSPHIYKGEPVPVEAMARYNQIRNKSLIAPPAESKPKLTKQNKK